MLSGPINFEESDVSATCLSNSVSLGSIFITRSSLICLIASLSANLYPEITVVGWTLFFINWVALLSNSAANITTEVVPSPTSLSWIWAKSPKILAAGCSMDNNFKIVAPSFVITTSPVSSTSILSRPWGPKLDLTTLDMDWTALELLSRTSIPVSLSPWIPKRLIY